MKKNTVFTISIVVAIIILSCISIFVGAFDVSLDGILNGDYMQVTILLSSRVPRLLATLCVGMGMSVAGLIMQNLCMNKFVSPTTGATISSAQLGVIVAMLTMPSANLVTRTTFAFVSALVGTWAFVWFIQKIQLKDVIMVPLIGIMFNSVIGGLVSYIAYENDLTQILNNMLVGDFSLILAGRYEIVFLIVPLIVIAFIYANHFNIVGMGEHFSTNLGVDYKFVMFMGLSIAAIITASVVVTVGTISYIGLIIPNIVSMFKGDKIRKSILDVALFGAMFVLLCDLFGRVIIRPFELPIELMSGIVGSIIFIIMLFKRLSLGRSKAKKGVKHA
ncbi:ABC transporter permease [Candidatus Epulonipiscium viviparus]|uniref:ABC transporter permease n=1 Tax=Candidatus Epulonipiscium viviparus TaxID=420336 RepID=UPI0027381008|nr:iron chelate uptake ABC transporter family permease subunit [Candidatus Epulopiscium viviparus]